MHVPLKFRALAFVALMAFLPGCAKRPQAGIQIKPITTELVFGVPDIARKTGPPNSNSFDDFEFDEFPNFDPGPLKDFPKEVLPPPPEPCGTADYSVDFPEPTTTTVVKPPKEGLYRFRFDLRQDAGPAIGVINIKRNFSFKIVENVVVVSPTEFTFDVLEPEVVFGSRNFVTQSYRVNETPNPATNSRDDNGIFLERIVTAVNGDFDNPVVFEPQPPLKILPTPTEIGSPSVGGVVQQPGIDAVGVDPVSQEVLRIRGTVINRFDVDACGDVVQGWFVDGTREFVSREDANGDGRPDSTVSRYNYMIANHMGGILIYEKSESPCAKQVDTNQETRADDPKNIDKCDPPGTLEVTTDLATKDPIPFDSIVFTGGS